MEAVDVLGDDRGGRAAADELGDGTVTGRAFRQVSSASKRRRQVSRRASSEKRKSEKSIGAIFVQIPPGLRKSGIPDSVLMPAPVNTTARRARSITRASSAIR